MAMHEKTKKTAWLHDGCRGRKISKKQCTKYERRMEQKMLKDIRER